MKNNPESQNDGGGTNNTRKQLRDYRRALELGASLAPQERNSETLTRDRNASRLKEMIKDPKNMRFFFLDVNRQIKEFVGNEARQTGGPTQVADSALYAWINFGDLGVGMEQEAAAARSVLGGIVYSDVPKFLIDYNGVLVLMYADATYRVDIGRLPKNDYTDKLKEICKMQAESKVLAPLKYGRKLQGKYETLR